MPLLIGVVSVLGFVAIVAIARRLIGFRSDEHAMESYEHALDVLGDASRRTDTSRVRIVPPDEVARAHIQSTEGDTDLVPRRGAADDVPPPRVRLEPPVLPGVAPGEGHGPASPARGTPAIPPSRVRPATRGAPAVPPLATNRPLTGRPTPGGDLVRVPDRAAAGDLGVSGAAASPPALAFDDVDSGLGGGPGRRRPRRKQGIADPGHERRVRWVATGGVALVAAAAVTVAALQLAGGPSKPSATSGTNATHGSSPQKLGNTGGAATTTTAPQATTTTTSAPPSSIVPETSSATEVSYKAPAPTYTITFQATTKPCWVGVQASAGGAWLWMETIPAGQSQTYSASGSVIVRLGAPPEIKVSVDGINVQLPPSNVQPYDLTFTPDS